MINILDIIKNYTFYKKYELANLFDSMLEDSTNISSSEITS